MADRCLTITSTSSLSLSHNRNPDRDQNGRLAGLDFHHGLLGFNRCPRRARPVERAHDRARCIRGLDTSLVATRKPSAALLRENSQNTRRATRAC